MYLRTCFAALGVLLQVATPVCAQQVSTVFGRFTDHADNPVFEADPGQWDSLIRERGWIMRDADGTYRLWYTGYNPDQQPLTMKLGYATSTDGLHWQRSPKNPIFDDVWVEDMMVVQHDGRYYMFSEGAMDQAQLLTSPDGLHWTRVGSLDVRLTNGMKIPDGPYGTPTALVKDGVWYLFYERRDLGVWLATSRDLKVWTNVSDDPVLSPGPEAYDHLMIAMNQVIHFQGRYYAVMHGTGTPQKPRQWCTYLASSDDLLHWEKLPAGPLLPVEWNRSSGQLVHDGERFRLYTHHSRLDVHFSDQKSSEP